MDYILGESDTEFQLETASDYKTAVLSMAQQARYSIDIFTQDMEPAIFDNQAIESAFLQLAKRHPKTKIRILVKDSKKAVQYSHCLIRLSQQLTSSIFIHKPSPKHEEEQSAFMIVDATGVVYRALANDRNHLTTANFNDRGNAARHLDFFDDAWEHSFPDKQTQRLYM